MKNVPFEVVDWAAQECTWQQSGEMSVLWMCKGWRFMKQSSYLSVEKILQLGALVEPRHNDGKDTRHINLNFGHSWEYVPELLGQLVLQQKDYEPDAWFKQYEDIHPFEDGNGRTGSILWNYLRGTLDHPEEPPDFWGHRNDETFRALVRKSTW